MGRNVVLLAMGLALVLGCDEPATRSAEVERDTSIVGSDERPTAHVSAPPASSPEFVREIVDWEGGSARIDYRVTGPAGLTGTMRLEAQPGHRRLDWSLELPIAGGDAELIEGSRIETPDVVWTSSVEGVPTVEPRPLRRLGRAYEALPLEARRRVIDNVRRWKDAMDRDQVPRDDWPSVAGTPCDEDEVAGARVCVEPTTGLPLRFEGAGFSVEATTVVRNAELDPQRFEVPDGATVHEAPRGFDPSASLRRIGEGDWAELVALTSAPLLPLGSTG